MARPKEAGWTYEVNVTARSRNNFKEPAYIINKQSHQFKNRREVLNWMKENYRTKNKRPMRGKPVFVDTKLGKPKRVGKVFGFWETYYDNPRRKYFREDWVSVTRVKRVEGW